MSDYVVTGMDCAACARSIERGVSALPGAESVTINFTTGKLRVGGDVDEATVCARVAQLGYQAARYEPSLVAPIADTVEADEESGSLRGFVRYLAARPSGRMTLAGLILILPGLLFDEILPIFGLTLDIPLFGWMALAALGVAGWPIARNAWRALVINGQITINLLMTIAAVGAVILGAWTEAGLVMVLFALGESLEGYTAGRARASLRSLLEIAPNEATVLRPCLDCREHLGQDGYTGGPCPFCGVDEQRVDVEQIIVGEHVVVRPGDKIPVDGRVVEGRSAINQAPITGESIPVDKGPGDDLFAGTINGDGALTIEVTRLAADTTIARIIRLVEEAQERRAPVQSIVDRFAAVYTPAVVVIAALVAFVPPLLFAAPFWGEQGWFYRALELLVVACPCALVISTPVTLVAAISRAAHLGILVKGGSVLQVLAGVNVIAFDKTGTLTAGHPQVTKMRSVACQTNGAAECPPCDDLLALATAVERRSEHALARAVTEHATLRGVDSRYPSATSVAALVGRGVGGAVNGQSVFVGSHPYFDNSVPHDPVVCADLSEATRHGQTPLLLSVDNAYAGYILVADPPRAESRAAVDDLRRLGITEIVMITGDEEATARFVAASIGVDDLVAQVLPAQKVETIEELKASGKRVAMVGDGINDAPALAAAHVGIAMGAGAAQAMETADAVLLANDLRQLPLSIRLARATMGTIRVNIVFSVALKVAIFVVVLAGLGSLWMAVVADVGASLLVTLNGMRLLRYQPPATVQETQP